jgi:hypothetical protein
VSFLLTLVVLPLLYLVLVVAMLAKRDRRGLGLSLFFAAVAVVTGIWAINESRASTAGIGMLGIPMMGSLAGLFALAFGRLRPSPEPLHRATAWVALAGAVFLVAFNFAQRTETKNKNNQRDQVQAAYSAEIARDKATIDAALAENPGRQTAYLDSAIRSRMHDGAFLIAALPHDSISPGVLDTLASSPNLNIALEAIRNPATSAQTLARLYRTAAYPDYFFQALAAHRHTPPEILRELYHRPRTISGLDIWFAGNPATPVDVLDEIAKTTKESYVVAQLIENPALDCKRLSALGVRLMKQPQRDPPDANVMRVTERLSTVCA